MIRHNHGVYHFGSLRLCAGCGLEIGICTIAISGKDTKPKLPKLWPFNTDDCPICFWRDKSESAFNSEDIASNFSIKTILNALIIKRKLKEGV